MKHTMNAAEQAMCDSMVATDGWQTPEQNAAAVGWAKRPVIESIELPSTRDRRIGSMGKSMELAEQYWGRYISDKEPNPPLVVQMLIDDYGSVENLEMENSRTAIREMAFAMEYSERATKESS